MLTTPSAPPSEVPWSVGYVAYHAATAERVLQVKVITHTLVLGVLLSQLTDNAHSSTLHS